jgi:hypothetical protein
MCYVAGPPLGELSVDRDSYGTQRIGVSVITAGDGQKFLLRLGAKTQLRLTTISSALFGGDVPTERIFGDRDRIRRLWRERAVEVYRRSLNCYSGCGREQRTSQHLQGSRGNRTGASRCEVKILALSESKASLWQQ